MPRHKGTTSQQPHMKAIASTINTARYNWSPIVASWLLHMQERGFKCVIVNNGGDNEKIWQLHEAIEHATACDEAYLTFIDSSEDTFWAFVVLGNDPNELVSDYSIRDTESGKAFARAIEEWSDSMEGTPCPHEGMTAWHYLRMAHACMVADNVPVPDQLAAEVRAGM